MSQSLIQAERHLICVLSLLATVGIGNPCLAADTSWQQFAESAKQELAQGHLAVAEEMQRRALALAQRGKESTAVLVQCQNALASTLTLRNRSDEAIALYTRSISELKGSAGGKSPQLVPTLLALGSIYEGDGDHTTAMKYYNQVLHINEAHFGPSDPEVGRSLHRIAKAHAAAHNYEESSSYFKRAKEIFEKQPGQSSDLKGCLRDYADVMRRSNHVAEAAELDNKANAIDATGSTISRIDPTQVNEEQLVESRINQSPSNNSDLSTVFNTLTDVSRSQSRFAAEEAPLQKILAIDEDTLGPNHPAVGSDLNNLAQLYIAQTRYAEAEPLLRRASTIAQTTYGQNNSLTKSYLTSFVSVLRKLNKTDEAQEIESQLTLSKGASHP